eukprot:scaffold288_cov108-Isochrysis_galbana.AAC.6
MYSILVSGGDELGPPGSRCVAACVPHHAEMLLGKLLNLGHSAGAGESPNHILQPSRNLLVSGRVVQDLFLSDRCHKDLWLGEVAGQHLAAARAGSLLSRHNRASRAGAVLLCRGRSDHVERRQGEPWVEEGREPIGRRPPAGDNHSSL